MPQPHPQPPSQPQPQPSRPLDLRLMVPALVSWAVLVVLLDRSAGQLGLAAAGAGASAVLARSCRARLRWASGVALSALVVAVVLTAAAGHLAVREAGMLPELARQRATVTVVGVVSSDPRMRSEDAERRPRVFVNVMVSEVVGRGQQGRASTAILVVAEPSWQQVRWHDQVRVTGRLSEAAPGQDVRAVLNARGPPEVTAPAGVVEAAAHRVRVGLRDAVDGLPADAEGLIPALVVGDRSLTPTSLTDDMRATGLTHLSAVSGANVAIVLGAVLLVARWVGLPRRARPWVAAGALAGFVVLARPEPSVLRAAAMGGIGLLGMVSSRRGAGLPALAGAVIVLLGLDPWLARSYGFALSVLASLGLLVFARPWARWMAQYLPRRWRPMADAIAVPVAAQAMCAPVVVLLQGSVTLIGVLANVLVAPFVAPVTVLGVLAAGTGWWAPVPARMLAWVAALPASAIAWVAHRLAGVPLAELPWPAGTPGALLLAGVIVAVLLSGPWLAARARRSPRGTFLLLSAAALLVAALTWPVSGVGWPPPDWRVVACDVGQGDGLVVATGPGRAMVVDTGPEPGALTGCLRRLGVTRVDALVLTHYHADHVGGTAGLLTSFDVSAVYATPVVEPAATSQWVRQAAVDLGLEVQDLASCDLLVVGDIVAQVVSPMRTTTSGSVPNNAGVVLDVDAAGLRAMLLADVEREAAAATRRTWTHGCGQQSSLPASRAGVHLVKVAHHGSANQDPLLLPALAPVLGVISVGADNDYGHPAPSVLQALARLGVTVLRTDRDGDIAVGYRDGALTVARRGR